MGTCDRDQRRGTPPVLRAPSRRALAAILRAATLIAMTALCAFPAQTFAMLAGGSGLESDVILETRISWQFDHPLVVLGRMGPTGPTRAQIVYFGLTRHPAVVSTEVVTESTRVVDRIEPE